MPCPCRGRCCRRPPGPHQTQLLRAIRRGRTVVLRPRPHRQHLQSLLWQPRNRRQRHLPAEARNQHRRKRVRLVLPD
ncbi:hypothetical protein RB213_014374 [Colletotrichum asianum]